MNIKECNERNIEFLDNNYENYNQISIVQLLLITTAQEQPVYKKKN